MGVANLNPGRLTGRQLIALQLVIAAVISVITWVFFDGKAALAALIGAMIAIVANIVFIRKAFSHSGARAARKILQAFYIAEMAKIGLTALLFAAVFIWGRLHPLPLLLGYIGVQCGAWIAPFLSKSDNT